VRVRSLISSLRFRHFAIALRAFLILIFLWLVSRYWHPHYGFTQFLQSDQATSAVMLSDLKDARLYVNRDPGSYDGFYYAQIATDPALRNPELKTAIDNPGYRARRILLGAIAWCLGFGQPDATLRAYAALNIFLWLALAVVLWRIFPVADPRATVAWTGLMFAAGTLLSVRFALPDLAAAMFLAAAMMKVERGQRVLAGLWIGLGALARDTALLGVAGLWPERDPSRNARLNAAKGALVAVLPLALWMVYVWTHLGPSGAGLHNFNWPFFGWFNKARDLWRAWDIELNHALVITSALSFVALSVQVVYLVTHFRERGPWWRMGLAFVALLASLGPAVWGDDFPGAFVRVLLPIGLAFNVLVIRRRAALLWLVLGNLSVGSGLLALWLAPRDPHEVAAGHFSEGTYVVHSSESWFVAEGRRGQTWAWCPSDGTLIFDTWPRSNRPRQLSVALLGFTPRQIRISQGERVVWEGRLSNRTNWLDHTAANL
jgi:hypothetical protein